VTRSSRAKGYRSIREWYPTGVSPLTDIDVNGGE